MKCKKCTFSLVGKIVNKLLCTFHSGELYLCEKENYDDKCPNFKERSALKIIINYIKNEK
jgi:hypothetical protein